MSLKLIASMLLVALGMSLVKVSKMRQSDWKKEYFANDETWLKPVGIKIGRCFEYHIQGTIFGS